MGEQVEGAKNEGEKKAAPKKDDGNATVVLRMDMHCQGCAKKVRRAVRNFEGVEDVKVDSSNKKITLTGKVDAVKIKERLEEKTRKKVDIISPPPNKEDAAPAGDKKPDEKKPAEVKKEEDKKPKQVTVILKIRLHCDGCINKIKKVILKIKGVDVVSVEAGEDLVTVTGTMDVKELSPYLTQKLKRTVSVVPPPPAKKDDAGGDKKDAKDSGGEVKKDEKEPGGEDKKEAKTSGAGDKKEESKEAPPAPVAEEKKEDGDGGKKDGGDGGAEKSKEVKAEEVSPPKMEVSKLEYHGYYSQPSYLHDPGQSNFYQHSYAVEPYGYHGGYAAPPLPYPVMINEGYPHYPLYPVDPRLHAPQMFSDENPNACSVM
ncbi:hypothetical protein SAY87_024055 [Trapa incisa]|uniref:HMA domain-containing protein n=1 Tax=Trapa incisa TaxID=236973 RepID=A0AAN7L1N1_9MYRT|nr:hypothetical protein SAY87_024055 [Trapa incisa]